jgi:hypothetical protein
MITEHRLYSDEHQHELVGSTALVFGGLICTDKGATRLGNQLQDVRMRYDLVGEMHWSRLKPQKLRAYTAWVDVFCNDPHARFLIFTVNKSSLEWKQLRGTYKNKCASAYHQYLCLAFGELYNSKRWTIYHDEGSSEAEKIRNVEVRFNKTYKNALEQNASRIIRSSSLLDSRSTDLIQLADVLLGAMSYVVLGNIPSAGAKRRLIEHCRDALTDSRKTQRGLPKWASAAWKPPEQFDYPSIWHIGGCAHNVNYAS